MVKWEILVNLVAGDGSGEVCNVAPLRDGSKPKGQYYPRTDDTNTSRHLCPEACSRAKIGPSI